MFTFHSRLLRQAKTHYTPEEIFKYLNESHLNGIYEEAYEDIEWVYSHDYFVLKTLSLDDPSVRWPTNCPTIYSKTEGPFPPICIASNGFVMDGFHRIGSARARGDQTIQAYVGVNESKLQLNEEWMRQRDDYQWGDSDEDED